MSRNKTFKTWEECRIWMCGAIGERWVRDRDGVVFRGRNASGWADMPSNPKYAPFTAIRDEEGDIPEEVALPELDAELVESIKKTWVGNPKLIEDWERRFQLILAQAVRMSKEGK